MEVDARIEQIKKRGSLAPPSLYVFYGRILENSSPSSRVEWGGGNAFLGLVWSSTADLAKLLLMW
jgi:hypothetical protein